MPINILLDNKALRRITMGMSASQARFLQLTARKSNVEYQAQRINFERTQLAQKAGEASRIYNEKMSNTKLVYSFNDGEGARQVDLTYNNYKNYINQQSDGLINSAAKMYLTSSSGSKIVVANAADMEAIISDNTAQYRGNRKDVEEAKAKYDNTEDKSTLPWRIRALATVELDELTGIESDEKTYSAEIAKFCEADFMIADDLDNVDNFKRCIEEGIYCFSTYDEADDNPPRFVPESWETLQAGAIREEYDKTDDAAAQAEYDYEQGRIQSEDKKLELRLDQLNTEREALTTEMESVKKVVEDSIESSFKVFS